MSNDTEKLKGFLRELGHENKIDSIIKDNETQFEDGKLISLSLRRIGIKELYNFDFGIFHHLRYLNLKHNMIKKIQSKNFNSVELKKLILDHNLIEKIDKNAFIHCINLEYLSLRTNSIKFLDKKIFHNNSKIEHLDLSNNSMDKVSNMFDNLSK